MSLFRDTFSDAPDPGTFLCQSAEVAAGSARSIVITDIPIVLVRHRRGLSAFVNACPHQYLPLDYRSAQILSADGERLMCSNHQATFDVATGEGSEGLAAGCQLIPVPVAEQDGAIRLHG